jgi:hypothetical protein
MPLQFKGAWRFNPPSDGRFINQSIPDSAVEECLELIGRVATQGNRREVLEHFKGYFCTASGSAHYWSSNTSWAQIDLETFAHDAARNAPLFIEAFYDACQSFSGDDPDKWAPDVEMINGLLAKHGIGYEIRPPRLEPREDVVAAPLVEVGEAPPTLTDRAGEILQTSLNRSEELLLQRRSREAVQESL